MHAIDLLQDMLTAILPSVSHMQLLCHRGLLNVPYWVLCSSCTSAALFTVLPCSLDSSMLTGCRMQTNMVHAGKTLLARAVANRTDACFIRVIGSELVQKYVGEGARMVRELFQMARSKKACLIFFDEVDAIGGARFDDGAGQHQHHLQLVLRVPGL